MWSQNFFSDWESWWSVLIGTALSLSQNFLGNSQPIGEFVCYLTMIHLWYTLCITHLWKDCRLADWGIAVLVMSFGFGDRDLVTWSNSTDSTSWWSNQLVTSKLLTMRTAGFDRIRRRSFHLGHHKSSILSAKLSIELATFQAPLPPSDLFRSLHVLQSFTSYAQNISVYHLQFITWAVVFHWISDGLSATNH